MNFENLYCKNNGKDKLLSERLIIQQRDSDNHHKPYTARDPSNMKLSIIKLKNRKTNKLSSVFNRTKTDGEHNFTGRKYIDQVEREKDIKKYFNELKSKKNCIIHFGDKKHISVDILPNCSKIDKLSPKNARPERISRPCSN